MKKLLDRILHRCVIVGLLIAIQIAVLILMVVRFEQYFVYFYAVCLFLSGAVVIGIVNSRSNPAYKIAWLIPVLTVPVFGLLFYLIFGGSRLTRHEIKKLEKISSNFKDLRNNLPPTLEELEKLDVTAANQSRYIQNKSYCPPFKNTQVEYLPLGEVKFARMLEELRTAEHFIFMEYFIIEEGKMWNAILDILKEKAAAGLDVRVIYDDIGCMMTLPARYWMRLEKLGIKCCVFNPFVPVLSGRFNNRDHRKICVIDGHTGFTGGINLADEYINEKVIHGHWKDVSVLLRGDAVWSLTVMFLSMWDYIRGEREDYKQFEPCRYMREPIKAEGYVQPYSDMPLDGEAVGETVYMNLIGKAERYVYINTPYLIISNEMVTALCSAAKCGIDVRIVTPRVGDKWYVHAVTRAYYEVLVEAGVKIYEYTPGFVHAKTFVADDKYAVVGTINLDYRSLYLHFECAAWMYRTPCIADIKNDYLTTLRRCQPVTLEQCRDVKWYRRLGRSILRVFAPLM